MSWLSKINRTLPRDNDALIAKAEVSKLSNAGGVVAGAHSIAEGDILGGLARLAAPVITTVADQVDGWAARINKGRANGVASYMRPLNGLKEAIVADSMKFTYRTKMAAAASFMLAGAVQEDWQYALTGAMHFGTNYLKSLGHRTCLHVSSALSGTCGALLLSSAAQSGNMGDTLSGLGSVVTAALLLRVDPKKLHHPCAPEQAGPVPVFDTLPPHTTIFHQGVGTYQRRELLLAPLRDNTHAI